MSAEENLDLSSVPGLGPVRRAALEAAGVTDLRGLLALTVEELSAVQGIGAWQARKIREFLRQHGLLVEVGREIGADGQEREVAIVREPRNADEAAVLADAVEAMAVQAAVEAELEEEARMLADAVSQGETAPEGALTREEADLLGQTTGARSAPLEIPVSRLSSVAGDPTDGTSKKAGRKGRKKERKRAAAAADAVPDEAGEVEEQDDEQDTTQEAEPIGALAGAGDDTHSDLFEQLSAQREQLPETALSLIRAIREAAVAPQLTRQITRLLITASEFVSTSRPLPEATRRGALETLSRAEQAIQAGIERRGFGPAAQRELARRIRRRRKELEALLQQG